MQSLREYLISCANEERMKALRRLMGCSFPYARLRWKGRRFEEVSVPSLRSGKWLWHGVVRPNLFSCDITDSFERAIGLICMLIACFFSRWYLTSC
jgi:hypothetical protein